MTKLKITPPAKTKPSDTKTLSPRAQELIQIAKDKVLKANASRGRAIVAIQDVYYHLLYEKYTQLEAGDICRRELVNYFSSRTLRRALPEVAKHQNMNKSSSTSNTDTNTNENENLFCSVYDTCEFLLRPSVSGCETINFVFRFIDPVSLVIPMKKFWGMQRNKRIRHMEIIVFIS